MKIIDGKAISAQIQEQIKTEVIELNKEPGLAVILVGEDSASCVYVNNKEKMCKKLGIRSFVYRLPEKTSEKELFELISKLNNDDEIDGIYEKYLNGWF